VPLRARESQVSSKFPDQGEKNLGSASAHEFLFVIHESENAARTDCTVAHLEGDEYVVGKITNWNPCGKSAIASAGASSAQRAGISRPV